MGAALYPPGRSLERILLFGIEGTGKTRAFLTIARATPYATHWILDNDNGVDRLLETEFSDLKVREEYYVRDGELVSDDSYTDASGTIVLIHAHGWENNAAAIEYIVSHATHDDWWCVDNAGNPWDDVQAWYVEAVHGLDIDDFMLQHRIASAQKKEGDKAPGASEAMFVEWNFINPVYKKRMQNHLLHPPCHLFMTAMQTDLNPRDKDKTTAEIYGGVSVKAKGQKGLGPNAQTVMWIKKYASGEWKFRTLKDRGREEWTAYPVDDFASDYLEGVAGWVSQATNGQRTVTNTSTGGGTSTPAKKVSATKKVAKKSG